MYQTDKVLNDYLLKQGDKLDAVFYKDGITYLEDADLCPYIHEKEMDKYMKARWWIFCHLS